MIRSFARISRSFPSMRANPTSRLRPAILMAAVAAMSLTCAALAQPFTYTFVPSNTVINTPVTTDFAIVGYSGGMYDVDMDGNFINNFTGPSSPTVNVAAGAVIPEAHIFNHSIVNVTGGSVDFAAMYDTSTLHVSGGMVRYALGLFSAEVRVTGGAIGELNSQGRLANVSGGTLGIVTANSNTDASGGVLGSSIVNITGGTFTSQVNALNDGILNLYGGNVFAASLRALEGGTLNIYGTGLSALLTNPSTGGSSLYTLSGLLSDGSSLDGIQLFVRNNGVTYGNSRFNLINIPTPGAAAVLALGGVLATRRRRGAR